MGQDWWTKHDKIPDTQFGSYPERSTLHPLFILQHLKDAAQKRQRAHHGCTQPSLISQANDFIPRSKVWDHLAL
jgi:hypothetical protein